MKLYAGIILFFISQAVTQGFKIVERDGKIVGGVLLPIEQAPYQVSLLYRSYHTCGGSIISTRFVLTACHCTNGYPASYLSVRVGSAILEEGGKVHKVAKLTQHPSFNPYSLDFDFAILELATVIKLNRKTVTTVRLPAETDVIADETPVLVSGWGYTNNPNESNRILRGVVVPTINQSKCDTIYRYDGGISPRMVCAGNPGSGKDSCNGDSGGPMLRVSDGVLIGIVSFGMDCADATYPGVYARVSVVRPWIKSVSGV